MDPITWAIIIGSALVGAGVGYFWDEIKEWATRMLGYILDAINTAIEVTSDAVVYLVKEGSRVYQRMEVYVRNVRNGSTRLEYRQKEIPRAEVPNDLNAQLDAKMKVKLMQNPT
ncbi:MAG: hypothetical protein HEQ35_22765 [Gloeotrichia echinulata IR180]|jgi:hypothetical protein|nr:hypothetical protein [Gloeotrichia echinulata DEX184]